MITVACPSCSQEIKVKDEYEGKTGKCKRCGELIRIPEREKSVFESEEYQKGLREAEARQKEEDKVPRNAEGKIDWYGAWCPNCRNRCSVKKQIGGFGLFVVAVLIAFLVFAVTYRPFYSLIGFILIVAFSLILPREWHCKNCQNRWRA